MRLRSDIFLYLILGASLLSGGCARTERTEAVVADIEAAQMQGRKAARPLLIDNPSDTNLIRRHLREISDVKNAYDSIGRHDCAAAYDSAFISTVRSVNPGLADKVRAMDY